MNRRFFLVSAPAVMLLALTRRREAGAQQAPPSTTPMNSSAHRPVRLPAKSGAPVALSEDQVRELELGIACQCSCGRDVYNCRTTDFTCVVSPAMHRDVQALVDGGYTADEIVEAFVDVYGEAVRMAPKASGFNTVAYVAPYVAMGGAAALVALWIAKSLRRHEAAVAQPGVTIHATDEELERIRRAMKDDE